MKNGNNPLPVTDCFKIESRKADGGKKNHGANGGSSGPRHGSGGNRVGRDMGKVANANGRKQIFAGKGYRLF